MSISSFNEAFKSLLGQEKSTQLSQGMLKVGDPFPQFKVKAVVSNESKNAFTEVSNSTYQGKWLVVFAWPKDFTFVCPTEIVEFGKLNSEFADRDAQILGFSTDGEHVHLAWRNAHEGLKHLPFPMLADTHRTLSTQCGILDKNEGVAQRATFIVDPKGIVRFVMVTDLSVGRNPTEVLRILDALQITEETGELCACNWKKGDALL